MADKAALVEQIKAIQRADADSKQAWWDYCDANLGGVKDPNRHDADVLKEFVVQYGGGGAPAFAAPTPRRPVATPTPAAAWGAGPWGGFGGVIAPGAWAGGGGSGDGSMAEFVKIGQRKSQSWKTAWQTYCAAYGTGMNDPSKYDETFICSFIDYVGQLAMANLSGQGAPVAMSQKRPMGGPALAAQPPAKRAAVANSFGGFQGGADPGKAELVEKVKALQRSSEDTKAAWWAFCDQNAQGVKDPNRHESSTLQQFLSTYE